MKTAYDELSSLINNFYDSQVRQISALEVMASHMPPAAAEALRYAIMQRDAVMIEFKAIFGDELRKQP